MYSSFIDNIWGIDLADMQLISKSNKEIRFFLFCVIDIFSKCAWVISVWGVNLADMQLISKFNKEILSSLCVIDIF